MTTRLLPSGRSLGLALVATVVAACAGEASSPCLPDEATFQAQVWQPVLAGRCTICHSSDGLAKSSGFVLSGFGVDAAPAMGANLDAARRMALATEDGEPLLLRRPIGVNHPGGVVITDDSPEYRALVTFVGRVRGDAAACAAPDQACQAGDPGPRLLRRLSRDEYDHSIAALFGVDAGYAPGLVADVVVNGFDNNARALEVSPLLAEQLRQAGEDVAAKVAATAGFTCAGTGVACARSWLEATGARVARRPLTEGEIARWLVVYQVGSEQPDPGVEAHSAGMQLMLAGLLQSPAFLYRSELGAPGADGRYALDSYEIATELAYLLWSAPPDDELWLAATRDELRDPVAIEREARRLLAAPQARAAIDRFSAQWLGVDRLATVPKDPDAYAAFTPEVRAAMGEEVRRQVSSAVQGGATLAELLDARTTWVNPTLAAYYGLPAPAAPDASGFGLVDATGREGLLASGAVLATHARANSSSPIHRGKLVRERLLCQPLPPPPPGLNAQPPAVDPSLTTRERYAAHAQLPACAGCHKLMDPIGFAFEHFDGIGRWRDLEGVHPIDATGAITNSLGSDGAFDGVTALGAHLAASPEVNACFSRQWLRWAYGVEDDVALACLAAEVEAAFAAKAYVIEDLIVALTQTNHFRFRLGAAATSGGDEPDAGVDAGPDDPDAAPRPDDTPGVTATVTRTDQWPTGYCADLVVTNTSAAAVTWRVTVTVAGTINNAWNSQVTQAGTQATFTGAPYNATLAPGAVAEAGFCTML